MPKIIPARLGGQKIFESQKSKAKSKAKKGEKVKYQYSIIQSKDSRLRTLNSREEAIIQMNKLKEAQPGNKYRLLAEKKPGKRW